MTRGGAKGKMRWWRQCVAREWGMALRANPRHPARRAALAPQSGRSAWDGRALYTSAYNLAANRSAASLIKALSLPPISK